MTQEVSTFDRLTRVTMTSFRGVRDTLSLDLDASVVIAAGPNGTGKTTIFDALLWTVRGDIPRLAEQRLRQTDEYIVNAYSRSREARVEFELRASGETWRAIRVGNSRLSNLEVQGPDGFFAGVEAERQFRLVLQAGDLPLRDSLDSIGLLQQDDLRHVLRDHPNARYMQVLRLLGLESLDAFERFLQDELRIYRARARADEQELQRLREQQAELEAEIKTFRELASSSELDGVSTDERDQFIETSMAVAAAADEAGKQLEVAIQLLPIASAPTFETDVDGKSAAFRRLSAENEVLNDRVREAEVAKDKAQADQADFGRMAALAIALLEHREDAQGKADCPVCSTHIQVAQVVALLREGTSEGAALADAEIALRAVRGELSQNEEELAKARDAFDAELDRRQQNILIQETISRVFAALDSALSVQTLPTSDLRSMLDSPNSHTSEWLQQNESQLLATMRQTRSTLSLTASVTLSAGRSASAEREARQQSSRLPRLLVSAENLAGQIRDHTTLADLSQRHENSFADLSKASSKGIAEVFRKRFATLEPLVNDIYTRLLPHPTFRRLDFRVDNVRSKGTATAMVRDEDSEIEANPLLLFSSAQANIVVLAVFLSMGWAAQPSLPFIWLDDPLQAMDDVNVLGFADLAVELRKRKQIVLSTHEDRFARLLERKLVDESLTSNLIVHRFQNWSRLGPTVETKAFDQPTDVPAAG